LLCFLRALTWANFVKFEVFEQVAKNAVRGLWARRSNLDLVGAHINVFTGEWTQKVTKNGFCICQKNYGLMNFASTN